MNFRFRQYSILGLLISISVGLFLAVVFWLLPSMQSLRQHIDDSRAAITIIQQQESNLTQLANDTDAIRAKQAELEQHVWLFDHEDDFYTALNTMATANHVTLSTPTIADATPTGALITRSGLLTISGSLTNILAVMTSLQHQSQLIVIQKLTIIPGTTTDLVVAKITFTTLWK